jgi:hypothetical protein
LTEGEDVSQEEAEARERLREAEVEARETLDEAEELEEDSAAPESDAPNDEV